ncbi:MAG: [Fe-Fe] hydrogenase large subunit C-terminal domain-containing protein [Bacillota bacterium]
MTSNIIEINPENCINCQKCIVVCPVEFCNSNNTDHIEINSEMCIACGKCITACQNNARVASDDWEQFTKDTFSNADQDLIAIVSPTIAANFPDNYLKINGWLDSIGIDAVFDISFGAELTAKSYAHYIKKNNPEVVLAQTCSVLVNYLQIYKPNLLDYLAPISNPMMNTIKMIEEFYPKYKNHQIVTITPCLAKRKELEVTEVGDYNILLQSVQNYFAEADKGLEEYSEQAFVTPDAEKAVLFSTPQGLIETLQRYLAEIKTKSRVLTGFDQIDSYLSQLESSIEQGVNPLVINCLNCKAGCNSGTGVNSNNKTVDQLEFAVRKRSERLQKKYKEQDKALTKLFQKNSLEQEIDKKWESSLYTREYDDLSSNNDIKQPSPNELDNLFYSLDKPREEDRTIDCNFCGYSSCYDFAVAIYNQLNQKNNCRFYKQSLSQTEVQQIATMIDELMDYNQRISKTNQRINDVFEIIKEVKTGDKETAIAINEISKSIQEISEGIESLSVRAEEITNIGEKTFKLVRKTDDKIKEGTELVDKSVCIMDDLQDSVNKLGTITEEIMAIADQTNLLSLDGAIEVANSGQGFGAVADDIKGLAEQSMNLGEEAKEIITEVQNVTDKTIDIMVPTEKSTGSIAAVFEEIRESSTTMRNHMEDVIEATDDQVAATNQMSASSEQVFASSTELSSQADELHQNIKELQEIMEDITEDNQKICVDFKIQAQTTKGLLKKIKQD